MAKFNPYLTGDKKRIQHLEETVRGLRMELKRYRMTHAVESFMSHHKDPTVISRMIQTAWRQYDLDTDALINEET